MHQGLWAEHVYSSPRLQRTPVQSLAVPITNPSKAWGGMAALSPFLLLRTGRMYVGRVHCWVRISWSVLYKSIEQVLEKAAKWIELTMALQTQVLQCPLQLQPACSAANNTGCLFKVPQKLQVPKKKKSVCIFFWVLTPVIKNIYFSICLCQWVLQVIYSTGRSCLLCKKWYENLN